MSQFNPLDPLGIDPLGLFNRPDDEESIVSMIEKLSQPGETDTNLDTLKRLSENIVGAARSRDWDTIFSNLIEWGGTQRDFIISRNFDQQTISQIVALNNALKRAFVKAIVS